ncbi:ribosylnicotinamide kinase [Coemansia sp. RSA 1804]|nr:ribosylnicotinamide kinase [Coemansia sp. RSA 1804]
MSIVFGLSGPSCSGKTTVALNLLKLFPRTVIIHQDDFYKPNSQIPVNEALGLEDWDCPASFDMDMIVEEICVLRKRLCNMAADGITDGFNAIRSSFASQWANPPDDVDKVVDGDVLESLKTKILHTLQIESLDKTPFSLVLVDGILLFHDSKPNATDINAEFDAGLFLYAQYDTLKQRREARSGYATKEGIWTDPPGYFDSIVWPNFIKYHKRFIHEHPQLLGNVINTARVGADEYTVESAHNACHIAVCSSEVPVASTLQIAVQMLLESWADKNS